MTTKIKLHSEGKVPCFACDKQYTSARGLREHITLKHKRISKFKCLVCGKAFARANHLEVHNQLIPVDDASHQRSGHVMQEHASQSASIQNTTPTPPTEQERNSHTDNRDNMLSNTDLPTPNYDQVILPVPDK